jgi:hypothetical protein
VHAWEEAISAAGGACTVCKTVEEWLSHPHALSAGLVTAEIARYIASGAVRAA